LAEIPALNSRFSRVNQKKVQELLRDRVFPTVSLGHFISTNIINRAERRNCVNILKKDALPLQFERELVVELK